MNIIIAPHNNNSFIYRPDSTLLRFLNGGDYFIPEYVDNISISPIIFLKTSKAGKSIHSRFMNRYIDRYGYGLILYPNLKKEIIDNRDFMSNSLDYTTLIPLEMTPVVSFHHQKISIAINGFDLSTSIEPPPSLDLLYERLSNITNYYSLRIGDFIGFELSTPHNVNINDYITQKVDDEVIFGFSVK